jgi:hypothetical protein
MVPCCAFSFEDVLISWFWVMQMRNDLCLMDFLWSRRKQDGVVVCQNKNKNYLRSTLK